MALKLRLIGCQSRERKAPNAQRVAWRDDNRLNLLAVHTNAVAAVEVLYGDLGGRPRQPHMLAAHRVVRQHEIVVRLSSGHRLTFGQVVPEGLTKATLDDETSHAQPPRAER